MKEGGLTAPKIIKVDQPKPESVASVKLPAIQPSKIFRPNNKNETLHIQPKEIESSVILSEESELEFEGIQKG